MNRARSALAAGRHDVALVELEPHLARDALLALVDRGLQHFALGREPEAIVDQLGVARHQLVLEVARAAVERDGLDGAMRREQDRAARRLVHAARLHADKAVLDEVDAADAVGLAERVQFVSSAAGESFLPSMLTASPLSKPMRTSVGLSGASIGEIVR